ncbi:hypothetical protein VTI28DRAFT_9784 [Corynascus sepedonium]
MNSEIWGFASSPDSDPSSTAITPPASGSGLGTKVRRRPIPRKGHTKSRRGCFNCKRRKVKCQETRPECSNCIRIGLDCEYPDSQPRQLVVRSSLPVGPLAGVPSPLAPLESTPTLFTPADMRLFHHFLVAAYPPLPIRGDDVWRKVATLSHTYDYLMHAMLGLAGSHLEIHGVDFSSQALFHRVRAINLLNQALSTPPTSVSEADARFAAIFALAFQASCMPEGMIEFLSMVKGCHIIGTATLLAYKDSFFKEFTQDGYGESVRKVIGTAPLSLNQEEEKIIQEFLESLHALAPLCTSPLEVRFLAAIERVVNVARVSAAEAFAQFAENYSLIFRATAEEFNPFIDPNHYSAQLLLIHFILIEFQIGYLGLGEAGRRFAYREKSCIAWMEHLAARLPDEYKKYAEWPLNFVRTYLVG